MQQYKGSAKIILAYKKLSENTTLVMFVEGNFVLVMPFNLKQILVLALFVIF